MAPVSHRGHRSVLLDEQLVRAWCLLHLGAVARPKRVEGTRQVDALVGVRTEEVALTLNQGGSEALAAKTVEV